ncbi:MAG: YhbY family RNA-binding protein, partial [Coprobacillus sp.]|nr:YhbY family RNA-binding protein [Coprobacillus sp.]
MLTQSQKKQLKALANNMDALYQIGKKELGEQQLIMLDKALEARELIKITVLKTVETPLTELAIDLSMKLHAEVIQVIGRMIVLYRKNRKQSKI